MGLFILREVRRKKWRLKSNKRVRLKKSSPIMLRMTKKSNQGLKLHSMFSYYPNHSNLHREITNPSIEKNTGITLKGYCLNSLQ